MILETFIEYHKMSMETIKYYLGVKNMGMYTGLRFKGIVKEEFRNKFADIALNGNWEESSDKVFQEFSRVPRAGFIPCGALAYMPAAWETEPYDRYGEGVPTDGFDRTYDKETGRWTFQCSLKNYCDTIEAFFEIVPYFIEEVEHAEVFYEEWSHSIKLDFVDGEMYLINDKFIEYNKHSEWSY